MKHLVFVLFLVACGGVSAQDHVLNGLDASEYSAEVGACSLKVKDVPAVHDRCVAYLACKCMADQKHTFDSGACAGKFQDGSECP